MAANDVYVNLKDLGVDPATFVRPTVPGAKREFNLVKDVVKAAIRAVNTGIEDEVFGELNVAVDAAQRTLTVTLDEEQEKRYIISEDVVVNYSAIDFANVMVDVLGFARVYEEDQLEAVQAVIPEGLEATYDEQTQKLTVRPAATAANFSFKEEDATLTTALFQGAEFVISFADNAIDIAKLIVNRDITLTAQDLVKAAPAVSAGSPQ